MVGLFSLICATAVDAVQTKHRTSNLVQSEVTLCEVVALNVIAAVTRDELEIKEAGGILYRCIQENPGMSFSDYRSNTI